jgi:hypothetical protein
MDTHFDRRDLLRAGTQDDENQRTGNVIDRIAAIVKLWALRKEFR